MTMLTPALKFSATFVDAEGYTVPAEGYKLYAYAAGTTDIYASGCYPIT